jgi:hypothetical protein
MNNVKNLSFAMSDLGFVRWMRINLTGDIQKYRIS